MGQIKNIKLHIVTDIKHNNNNNNNNKNIMVSATECCYWLLFSFVIISPSLQHGSHHHGDKKGSALDGKHVQDMEHIKEHLKEENPAVKTDNLSEADTQFHYFKAHDSDNDDKLDGIELANAMAHYHDEDAGEKPEDYTEHELASMVDQILDEDDLNKDGYIDYPEFIASQKREETEA